MLFRILSFWHWLKASFWFIPALMVIGAALLWIVMNQVDAYIEDTIRFWWVYTGGVEGARSILSSIATSTITVAGTVFSITIAVLSFSSRQFGSRIIRRFINDRGNQVVLGTFLATFIYCLLKLGTSRGTDADSVPQAGIMTALVLAVASIGVLVYFIHHIAVSIQSNNVIFSVINEVGKAVGRVFPDVIDHREEQKELKEYPALPEDFNREAHPIKTGKTGYLQEIDLEGLIETAIKNDLVLQLQYRVGDFINRESGIVKVHPGGRLNGEAEKSILRSFVQGSEQSSAQDVGYSLDRLVQIALTALSPSYNDPFTAISCIDWIGAVLSDLAGRKIPSPNHYDRDGRVRVVEKPKFYSMFVETAFNKFPQAAGGHPDVLIYLLDTLASIAGYAVRPEDRTALLHQADRLSEAARLNLEGSELQRVLECYRDAVEAFREG